MLLLRWIWIGNGKDGEVPPMVVFWALRVLMFVLSFVLEDWAIHELIQSKRYRKIAVLLVASSYVTWTYQMHTFSNSIETLLVAWCLVLIQKIVRLRVRIYQNECSAQMINISYIAANISTRLRHLSLLGGLWSFQQDYISGLLVYTGPLFDSPFYEEASRSSK
jgi:phosphatidylinositol glycan class Z